MQWSYATSRLRIRRQTEPPRRATPHRCYLRAREERAERAGWRLFIIRGPKTRGEYHKQFIRSSLHVDVNNDGGDDEHHLRLRRKQRPSETSAVVVVAGGRREGLRELIYCPLSASLLSATGRPHHESDTEADGGT